MNIMRENLSAMKENEAGTCQVSIRSPDRNAIVREMVIKATMEAFLRKNTLFSTVKGLTEYRGVLKRK